MLKRKKNNPQAPVLCRPEKNNPNQTSVNHSDIVVSLLISPLSRTKEQEHWECLLYLPKNASDCTSHFISDYFGLTQMFLLHNSFCKNPGHVELSQNTWPVQEARKKLCRIQEFTSRVKLHYSMSKITHFEKHKTPD